MRCGVAGVRVTHPHPSRTVHATPTPGVQCQAQLRETRHNAPTRLPHNVHATAATHRWPFCVERCLAGSTPRGCSAYAPSRGTKTGQQLFAIPAPGRCKAGKGRGRGRCKAGKGRGRGDGRARPG